jgi:hypothetical protein
MSFFAIIAYSLAMVTLGYMIGHDKGESDGYVVGRADMYKEKR